jgi:BON domain
MKFPKSVHAEGWADHIDTTKSDKPAASPLHAAKAPGMGVRMNSTVTPSLSTTPPVMPTASPRIDPQPAAARPQARTAALPPQRESRLSWMIAAGAGVAVLAAVAIWTANRPAELPNTPPPVLIGSTEPQAEVAAVAPLPEPVAAASQAEDTATTTVAAAPVTPEPAPARVGLPVTTSKPAVEARPVAQAPVPAARPDMVLRAAPNSPSSTLQPPVTVATAPTLPAADAQPLSLPPGSAPIVMPPTSAGPATVPQAVTPSVASAAPATAASATAPGMPPLAQAQAQAQAPTPAQPLPEDSGITVNVRMALAADATLSAVPIAVSTAQGVVKLEGQAPDTQTRERATVVAASTTGVKAVDNRLTLPPAAVLSQAPASVQ